MSRHYNVLFLCTGNSARSILAEAILNKKGFPNFTAYSAGSHPSGKVRPEALRQLERARIATDDLRSKSWEEFSQDGAPPLAIVTTVGDSAAAETRPVFFGRASQSRCTGATQTPPTPTAETTESVAPSS
jgi:arsenate reductase